MLEKHREAQEAAAKEAASAKKKSKKRKAEGEGSKGGVGDGSKTKEQWEGNHPWRPFDRDKDLEIARKPANSAAFIAQSGALSSKFSKGGR